MITCMINCLLWNMSIKLFLMYSIFVLTLVHTAAYVSVLMSSMLFLISIPRCLNPFTIFMPVLLVISSCSSLGVLMHIISVFFILIFSPLTLPKSLYTDMICSISPEHLAVVPQIWSSAYPKTGSLYPLLKVYAYF